MDYASFANYERSDDEELERYHAWMMGDGEELNYCELGYCKPSASDLSNLADVPDDEIPWDVVNNKPASWCPVNECTHNKFGECACSHECPVEFEEF